MLQVVVPLVGPHAKGRRVMEVREVIVVMTLEESDRCIRQRVQVVEMRHRCRLSHAREGQCIVAIVSNRSDQVTVGLAGSR